MPRLIIQERTVSSNSGEFPTTPLQSSVVAQKGGEDRNAVSKEDLGRQNTETTDLEGQARPPIKG